VKDKDIEIEVTKGKDGVTIFGRPVIDPETGKPIKKEDMRDKGIEVVKESKRLFEEGLNADHLLATGEGIAEKTAGKIEVIKGKEEIILTIDGKKIASVKEEDVFKIEVPEGVSDKKEEESKGEKADKAGAEEEKIETTDQYHRIPVNTSCKITATITISASKGIKALYCGEEKKVHTYLFDVAKFSMAEAKAWVKENSKGYETGFKEFLTEGIKPSIEYRFDSIDEQMKDIWQDIEQSGKLSKEADKEEEKQEEFKCECIKCGWKHTSEKHCDTYKCEKCGGEMRRVERPGPGKDINLTNQTVELRIMDMPELKENLDIMKEQIAELKEGRVLSTKNRTLVKDIRDLIRELDGKLTSLLDATEPTSREEERAVNVEHQVIIEKDDDKVGIDKLATAIESALSGDSLKKMLDKSLEEAVDVAIKKKLGKVE